MQQRRAGHEHATHKSPIGLDGIAAAETVLSHVDGEQGELIIAGERVADLARKTGFEGVTARLWSGGDRTADQRSGRARRTRRGARAGLCPAARPARQHAGLSIVDGFRAAIAALRAENGLTHEATIVGALPVIAGALVQRAKGDDAGRARSDKRATPPTRCRCCWAASPTPREVAALDAYFVTVCDHGMNASTFTTRVVASTQADLFAPSPPAIAR